MKAQATDLGNYRTMVRGIKNAMIGFASTPWTVLYSCDSAVAGSAGDAIDRWDSDSDLVWNNTAGAKSWIILKQTGISSNFQICISLNTAGSGAAAEYLGFELVVSPNAGFTGGTTSARPTATDETIVNTGGTQWLPTFSTGFQMIWNVVQSTDGSITRIWMDYNSFCSTLITIEKPADAVTGWTYPWVSIFKCATGGNANAPTYANLNDIATGAATSHGGTSMTVFLTSEGSVSSMTGERQTGVNDISNEWPICPVGIESQTATRVGRHGRFVDLWWGSTAHQNAALYPDDGTRTFRHLGNLIIPWNGTPPQIA